MKEEFVATGRRKTAVASVRLRPGSGQININHKASLEEYFQMESASTIALAPLNNLSLKKNFDMIIRVHGGGLQAQSEAIRLGISRALVKKDESFRPSLKSDGFLTRDPRMKERKKYGQPGARKKSQFSKR